MMEDAGKSETMQARGRGYGYCSKEVAEGSGQVRTSVVEPGLEAKLKKEELRMMNYGG
jgi:hypothetical protein